MSADERPEQRRYTLQQSAVALHEFWSNLIEAGFTADQALYIVGQMVKPQ
jgi:hypothetical protein